jgi:hypothetical protein
MHRNEERNYFQCCIHSQMGTATVHGIAMKSQICLNYSTQISAIVA